MKQFAYVITHPLGIHARPAGMLAKLAKNYDSTVTLSKDGKEAKAGQLMRLMGLGAKQGSSITVTVEGPDEEIAAEAVEAFLKENL